MSVVHPRFQGITGRLEHEPAGVPRAWGDRRFDWMGSLHVDPEVVGVAMLSDPDGVSWAKCEGRGSIRLLLHLYLGWMDGTGRDVGANWSVTSGQVRARTVLGEPATPSLGLEPVTTTVESGVATRVFAIDGSVPLACGLLMIPAECVRMGRNRLWNLRPGCRDGVPEPWLRILTHGRTGRLGRETAERSRLS